MTAASPDAAPLPGAVDRAIQEFADGRAVSDVRPMPGNAGFSYGFVADGEGFVLRVPPPGARHEGSADVLRQARLLGLLARTPVPVTPVRATGEDPVPWFVVDRLSGATIRPTATKTAAFDAAQTRTLALAAVDALRTLHDVPAPSWLGPVRTPAQAVTRWDRFAERAAEPALLARAPALRERLLSAAPARPATGIVHGDYQWGNLFGGPLTGPPTLLAVIDWELAHEGSVLDDLGWLCLFSDPAWWSGTAMTIPTGIPTGAELCARYGIAEDELTWHVAYAAYAFAVVIGLNLMLHRRGKRHDPYWELLAPSAPVMVARALRLLG